MYRSFSKILSLYGCRSIVTYSAIAGNVSTKQCLKPLSGMRPNCGSLNGSRWYAEHLGAKNALDTSCAPLRYNRPMSYHYLSRCRDVALSHQFSAFANQTPG